MKHLLLLMLALPSLGAQVRSDSTRPLFGKADIWIAAGFVGTTVAMFPLDDRVATAVRDSQFVNNRTLERTARVFGFTGSYAPFIIGAGLYGIGRLADKPRLAHLAVHGGEAVLVGLVATGVLKTALGRARPNVSDDPDDFQLGRGVRGDPWQSFPSGHSTTIFATAAAATAELSEWYPRSRWIVGPLLYGTAAVVGLSRVYEDKHWASDVVMGAAIGTFAGLKTVRYAHSRKSHWADRWFLGESDAQSGASSGASLGASSGPPSGAPSGAQYHVRLLPTPDGLTLSVSSRW